MKKVLVTGAAGFIGSHVVRELLKKNVEVRALVMPGENTANIEGMEIEKIQGDVLDKEIIKQAVAGVDTVFHLAAIFTIWMKDWRGIYEVNLQGSRNVLWAALEVGVKRVVYTSSIAAIGVTPKKAPTNETVVFNQYGLGNHYVITKYLSQQEALEFNNHGLEVVVVNPAFPFGENDIAPTPTGQLIVDVLSGKAPFFFSGGLNIIDVLDIARGHVLAAEKGKPGEKYILANRNIEMKAFIRMVYQISGVPDKRLIPTPVWLARGFAAGLTWWSNHVSHRTPLTTPSEIKYLSQYLFCDNHKARTELGLELTPVEDSLVRSIRWFRANGYV